MEPLKLVKPCKTTTYNFLWW